MNKLLLICIGLLFFLTGCSQGLEISSAPVENTESVVEYKAPAEVESSVDKKNQALNDFYENNRGGSLNVRLNELSSDVLDFYISEKEEVDIEVVGENSRCQLERNFFTQRGDNSLDLSYCDLTQGEEYDIIITTKSGKIYRFELNVDEDSFEASGEVEEVEENCDNVSGNQEENTVDFEVVQVYTGDTSDGEINKGDSFFTVLRLGPGSSPIKLENIIIKLDSQTGSQSLFYGDVSSEGEYNVSYISNSGNPQTQGYLTEGDLVIMEFNNSYTIRGGGSMSIKFLTKAGVVKTFGFVMPSTTLEEITYFVPNQNTNIVSKSLCVGRQSQELISTEIEVVQVYAQDTSDGEINEGDSFFTVLRLGSGSVPVKLDDLIIKLGSESGSQSLAYGDMSSEDTYNVSYISNSGIPQTQGYIVTGDLILVEFENSHQINEGESATMRILTKNSAVKPVNMITPSAMVEETTYLFP